MVSPLLPWEVLERIIGHSGNYSKTLHNFSLTCRDLRPRALCLLVADVRFKRRVDIFDFCDFVRAKPHLKPFVRSVTVNPADFSPFPLLSILPNLLQLKFSSPRARLGGETIYTVLNMSSTRCCKVFSTHIRALHLYNVFFPTFVDLARVLLAFPNITRLACSDIFIKAEGNQGHLDILKQRLSERLHLRTVFSERSPYRMEACEYKHDGASFVAGLVSNSELMRSTVETLTWQPSRSHALLQSRDWPRLQSLVLKLEFYEGILKDATATLNEFSSSSSTLKDVMIEFRDSGLIPSVISDRDSWSDGFEELIQSLLRFPRLRVACLFDCAVRADTIFFWTGELAKHFQIPALLQPGAFTVAFESVIPGAGHDTSITDLATSPDGKWVATASGDCTICLWDAAKGTMVHQWIPNDYTYVTSLAFSPDSRYLSSGGRDAKLKIWDLAQNSHDVTTLEGHDTSAVVTCCMWSPRGDIIASGYKNYSTRLWEASSTSTSTFHLLHEIYPPSEHLPRLLDLNSGGMEILQFSPDGSWLFSATLHSYYIWNIVSGGTLHISSPLQLFQSSLSAVFDPQSRRYLASVAGLGVVKVLDIETRERLLVLMNLDEQFRDVSFSPDGKSVLTASDSGTLHIWDASTGFELCSLKDHTNSVTRACFSPCGEYIASASWDHTVRLWRSRDGRCVATFKDGGSLATHVAFSGDGKTLWFACGNGAVIMRRIVDVIPTDEGDPLVA